MPKFDRPSPVCIHSPSHSVTENHCTRLGWTSVVTYIASRGPIPKVVGPALQQWMGKILPALDARPARVLAESEAEQPQRPRMYGFPCAFSSRRSSIVSVNSCIMYHTLGLLHPLRTCRTPTAAPEPPPAPPKRAGTLFCSAQSNDSLLLRHYLLPVTVHWTHDAILGI